MTSGPEHGEPDPAHLPVLRRVVAMYRHLPPGVSRKDVEQEAHVAYEQAMRDHAQLSAALLPGYLFQEMRNHLHRYIKEESKHEHAPLSDESAEAIPDHRAGPVESASQSELADHLREVLTPRQACVAVRLLEGWTAKEIAADLGVTEARVSQLREEAKSQLRKEMGERA